MEYSIGEIRQNDLRGTEQMESLLHREGINRDSHLAYTAGVFDTNGQLVATGSLFGATLRCLAVDSSHQGENLLGMLVSHLLEKEAEMGNTHIFLYTKPAAAKYFRELGFYIVEEVPGRLVFMENRRNGFSKYLEEAAKIPLSPGSRAAVVMNANPFTLGHKYLLSKAASENDSVVVFVLSEDVSQFSAKDRLEMVRRGAMEFPNVTVVPSGSYIISSATFPSYFLKESRIVTETHATLDSRLFVRIASAMGITARYVGDEPFSESTAIYNSVLANVLPENGIRLQVVPRLEIGGKPVSASEVRRLINQGNIQDAEKLLPGTSTVRRENHPLF